MGTYSYDDFKKAYDNSGHTFSEADLKLAQKNPDAGMTILQYKNDAAKATTAQQKATAHAGAEKARKTYGGYSGGADGSGYYVTGNGGNNYSQYAYDPGSDAAYQSAMSALEEAKQGKPTYTPSYDAKLQELYNGIIGREDFKYDASGDALYQQYADLYRKQGQMAMMDTMGQAAALTGGYGSSYGQAVGQQNYDAKMQELTEMLPEFEQRAFDRYQAEGDRMLNEYSLTADMADDEYAKYSDDYDRWYQEMQAARDEANTAYERGSNNWYNSQQLGMEQEQRSAELEQQEREDARQQVLEMLNMGVMPSNDLLAAAGLSEEYTNAAYDNYFNSMSVEEMQQYLNSKGAGLGNPDGVWGPNTEAAYQRIFGKPSGRQTYFGSSGGSSSSGSVGKGTDEKYHVYGVTFTDQARAELYKMYKDGDITYSQYSANLKKYANH